MLVDELSEQYCLVDDNSEEGLDPLVDISDILFDISPLLVSQLQEKYAESREPVVEQDSSFCLL